MTVTVASFRLAFPEFASAVTYPDPEIAFWLALGSKMLNADRWGDLFDFGQQLFMAHNLCFDFNAKAALVSGNNPGAVIGPQSSATVDKVGYTRDTQVAMDPKNGHWNLSTYGLRYIQLVCVMGAGPVQIGAGWGGACQPWAGPWQSNFPNPS